jgi:hypothetical protein
MGQITINGVVKTVDDDVQKYIEDCERDVKNALAAAESAKATIAQLQNQVKQEIANDEAKVKAAEAKLIGWVEARAHSFFLSVDGNFNRVASFLKHVAQGLEPHAQPKTIGGGAPAVMPPAAAAPEQPTASAPATQSAAPAAPSAPAAPGAAATPGAAQGA